MKTKPLTANLKTIATWRGNCLVCPQALSGDVFGGCSMGCVFCFCREMDQEVLGRYFIGWERDLVRPCQKGAWRRTLAEAYSGKGGWVGQSIRQGFPVLLGTKAETFADEDTGIVLNTLNAFIECKHPVIFETKSVRMLEPRYLEGLLRLKEVASVAFNMTVGAGSDALYQRLEPRAPLMSARWDAVKELNARGLWTGIKWEPILLGINSHPRLLVEFADRCVEVEVPHVTFYNYRFTNWMIAAQLFYSAGFDYAELLERNASVEWLDTARFLFKLLRERGIPASCADFVNFPFDSSCESCCGMDLVEGMKIPQTLTMQRAISYIKARGQVTWTDMEDGGYGPADSWERMRKVWNGSKKWHSLADVPLDGVPQIEAVDRDGEGFNVYRRVEEGAIRKRSRKLL